MSAPSTGAMFTRMVGTPSTDTATVALAGQCLTDAENEIKKRLAKRYDFTAAPFDTTTTYPPQYTSLVELLAIGYMYENMARGSKDSYARADRYIKKVSDNINDLLEGNAQLLDTSGNPVSEIDGEWTVYTTTNYPNTFNEDDPENWKVSSDKLDDIEALRDE